MYRIYKKSLHSDEGDLKQFGKKWYVLEENLWLISGSSLKIRKVSYVCNFFIMLQALLVAVSWILDLCCRKKIDKTKDIEKEVEQIIDSFTNYKCYGANDVKELSG